MTTMLSLTPRVPAAEPGKKYFWAVKLWWKTTSDNAVETGGHFTWNEGDQWLDVLQDVIKARGVDPDSLTSVEIALVER
jgi:hypothetical protein